MVIKKSNQYKKELKVILEYIAKDKVTAMIQFRKELNSQINNLINMPYKYRKSYYHNDKMVRDMIFRGYTIIYKVYDTHIFIAEIFNQNLPIMKNEN